MKKRIVVLTLCISLIGVQIMGCGKKEPEVQEQPVQEEVVENTVPIQPIETPEPTEEPDTTDRVEVFDGDAYYAEYFSNNSKAMFPTDNCMFDAVVEPATEDTATGILTMHIAKVGDNSIFGMEANKSGIEIYTIDGDSYVYVQLEGESQWYGVNGSNSSADELGNEMMAVNAEQDYFANAEFSNVVYKGTENIGGIEYDVVEADVTTPVGEEDTNDFDGNISIEDTQEEDVNTEEEATDEIDEAGENAEVEIATDTNTGIVESDDITTSRYTIYINRETGSIYRFIVVDDTEKITFTVNTLEEIKLPDDVDVSKLDTIEEETMGMMFLGVMFSLVDSNTMEEAVSMVE